MEELEVSEDKLEVGAEETAELVEVASIELVADARLEVETDEDAVVEVTSA